MCDALVRVKEALDSRGRSDLDFRMRRRARALIGVQIVPLPLESFASSLDVIRTVVNDEKVEQGVIPFSYRPPQSFEQI